MKIIYHLLYRFFSHYSLIIIDYTLIMILSTNMRKYFQKICDKNFKTSLIVDYKNFISLLDF